MEYDKTNDCKATGTDLTHPMIADIIKKILHALDNDLYELLYFCIMPNHVHLLLYTGNTAKMHSLAHIMKIIKGRSSREINVYLKRSGTFWQKASYDRLVRDEKELSIIADYIVENPVKAGIIDDWEQWPHSYIKYS